MQNGNGWWHREIQPDEVEVNSEPWIPRLELPLCCWPVSEYMVLANTLSAAPGLELLFPCFEGNRCWIISALSSLFSMSGAEGLGLHFGIPKLGIQILYAFSACFFHTAKHQRGFLSLGLAAMPAAPPWAPLLSADPSAELGMQPLPAALSPTQRVLSGLPLSPRARLSPAQLGSAQLSL